MVVCRENKCKKVSLSAVNLHQNQVQ